MDERRMKTETPRGRLADDYRALLDNEKYKDFIVYTKSKPHGFSLGKQIICAPSSVLDELEEKIKSIEEYSNSIARPGTKPVKVKYQRLLTLARTLYQSLQPSIAKFVLLSKLITRYWGKLLKLNCCMVQGT